MGKGVRAAKSNSSVSRLVGELLKQKYLIHHPLPIISFRPFFEILLANGLATEDIECATGINQSRLDNPGYRVPIRQLIDLVDICFDVTGDPALGLWKYRLDSGALEGEPGIALQKFEIRLQGESNEIRREPFEELKSQYNSFDEDDNDEFYQP